MLIEVPTAINELRRNVVINHPNSFNCVILRKKVNRIADIEMGLPTLGGLGVLSADDEEDIEFEVLGNGFALPVGQFQPAPMMERLDANNGQDETRFSIEPENILTHPNGFAVKNGDLLYLLIANTRIAYEIVSVETVANIPPYGLVYVCNRRNDFDTSI